MIGDRALDIACGRRAGCGLTILVRSGRHALESELQALGVDPDWIADDLSAAARWLLDRRNM
jgi:D-glycero-D-manno-heptose 1,7-bisphosphate phosphatase